MVPPTPFGKARGTRGAARYRCCTAQAALLLCIATEQQLLPYTQ